VEFGEGYAGVVSRSEPVLVFDGDCGICSSSARFARRILRGRARVVPYQRADLDALGITPQQASEAVWWIERDGRRGRGHRAIAAVLGAAGGIWRPLGAALGSPTLDAPGRWVYEWVSRNRHRLPGGTPECRLPRASRDRDAAIR
jgi:predicted DCC family thiol-disulfide oxidoreductase YuxK